MAVDGHSRTFVEAVPDSVIRVIVNFCVTGGKPEADQQLITRLSDFRDVTLRYLSNTIMDVENARHLNDLSVVRAFTREAIMNGVCAEEGDFESHEYEDLWCDVLVETVKSGTALQLTYPTLVSDPVALTAYLNLFFVIGHAGNESDRYDLVTPETLIDSGLKYMQIADFRVIQLVCQRPQEWERIATMMVDSGVTDPEVITTVLDGHVPLSLADGML